MDEALLIIDIQNDYFKGGLMELYGSEEASLVAKRIIDSFREKKLPIIYMQHLASAESSFFKPDTVGIKIHSNVNPIAGEHVITKHYPNSFRDTELNSILKDNNINDLVICGMMTHMCIDTTVRAAYELGYNNTLIHDACATKDLEFKSIKIGAEKVQASYMSAIDGTFAKVLSSEEFLEKS